MRLPTFALPTSLAAALAVGFALASVACASTRVEHVWRAPDWRGSFTRVAVFARTPDPTLRAQVEAAMVDAFANVGVAAVPSVALFPSLEGEPDDEEIARVLREREIDAALVARVVGLRSQAEYVDGHPLAAVDANAPNLYGDLRGRQAVLVSPDIAIDLDILTVETNLYATANSELVWSGLSELFEPERVDETIEAYAQTMVTALVEIDLVTRTLAPGAIETRD